MPLFIMIVAMLLILGIAYFQVSQGLFNSLITAVLTILSAVLTMAMYEPIVDGMNMKTYIPSHAEGITFILTFCALIYGLRAIFDLAIKGNVVFGTWPDRIGGGAFGLITGIIMVGMWILTLHLLPFDPCFLTYRPFDKTLQRTETVAPFYPDDFVLGMTNMLSEGSLKTGDNRYFNKTHENLLLDTYCWRNTKVDKNDKNVGRKDTKPNSMIVVPFTTEAATQAASDGSIPTAKAPIFIPTEQENLTADWFKQQQKPRFPLLSDAEAGKSKYVIVRVAVHKDLAEESTSKGNPADGWYFMPGSHFRLVGRSLRSYYPVGYLTFQPADPKNKPGPGRTVAETDTGYLCICAPYTSGKSEVASLIVQRPGSCTIANIHEGFTGLVIDWVFQVPAGESFCPTEQQKKDGDTNCGFIVFRRNIRQDFDAELPTIPIQKDMLLRKPINK